MTFRNSTRFLNSASFSALSASIETGVVLLLLRSKPIPWNIMRWDSSYYSCYWIGCRSSELRSSSALNSRLTDSAWTWSLLESLVGGLDWLIEDAYSFVATATFIVNTNSLPRPICENLTKQSPSKLWQIYLQKWSPIPAPLGLRVLLSALLDSKNASKTCSYSWAVIPIPSSRTETSISRSPSLFCIVFNLLEQVMRPLRVNLIALPITLKSTC